MKTNTLKIITTRSILILLLTFYASFMSADIALGPYQVINQTSKLLIAAIDDGHSYFEEDPEKFYDKITHILEPVVDFRLITRGVMGKYFKKATQEQRTQFLTQFKSGLVQLYAKTFLSLGVNNIEIVSSSLAKEKLRKQTVSMKIETEDGGLYSLTYSMIKNSQDDWLVRNMIIDGINLGLIYRNQFRGAMKQNNEDMNQVIKSWQNIVNGDQTNHAAPEG